GLSETLLGARANRHATPFLDQGCCARETQAATRTGDDRHFSGKLQVHGAILLPCMPLAFPVEGDQDCQRCASRLLWAGRAAGQCGAELCYTRLQGIPRRAPRPLERLSWNGRATLERMDPSDSEGKAFFTARLGRRDR